MRILPGCVCRAGDVILGASAVILCAGTACRESTAPGWQNLHIESGAADTLYQRSISLRVSTTGIRDVRSVDLVVDPGTAAEQHGVSIDLCTSFYSGTPHCAADSSAWWIDVLDTLANGPHRLVLQLSDAAGIVATRESGVVIDVAAQPYTLTPLPGLGGTASDALDVNATGTIAGWANDAADVPHAVTWREGAITRLPTSATARSSIALALNDAGEVVGAVVDTVGAELCERGIRWPVGTWRYDGVVGRSNIIYVPVPSYCYQRVVDINATGAVLIRAPTAFGVESAWLEQAGALTTFTRGFPTALNDHGEVVGFTYTNDPSAFSWNVTVALPITPRLGGRATSELFSINNRSQVLGQARHTNFLKQASATAFTDLNPYLSLAAPIRVTDNGTVLAFDARINAAFLWRDGRTARVALTTPGWRLDGVANLNDAGVIVGHATEGGTGRRSAVVLRPTP